MASPSPSKIAIITCSIRTPRLGPTVSEYITSTLSSRPNYSTYEYVNTDLASFSLPLFDEPVPPAMVPNASGYKNAHTVAWSTEISKYAAYVFVTPEYNYGVPASTKNAVDFLYNEWTGKPVLIISYGVMGGKASSEALAKTLDGMKMRVCSVRPNLGFKGGQGPDMFAAATEGRLGEETRKMWDEEYKSIILEGVKELEEKLAAPPTKKKEEK
jgi:NAD(P)H-dependent FMN reductase